ncbi:MAG: RdgB/HAM1 family non-canonical purine NTP pyrophosphatase [Chloroflexota bacterium]
MAKRVQATPQRAAAAVHGARTALPRLLLATNNPGKIGEYRLLLRGASFELLTPADVGVTRVPEETGATLEENALLKACAYARAGNLLALADDSGLFVDALGGEPGVRSARFAGEGASDAQRNALLLRKLDGVPEARRMARFRCVIAIALPDGLADICQGYVDGVITREPRGRGGWGYDPVFYLSELDKTMGELPPSAKNRLSHRGRAARKARALLKVWAEWLGGPSQRQAGVS